MTDRVSTHWEDCWRVHLPCAVAMAERLAGRVEDLEDALSVLGHDPDTIVWKAECADFGCHDDGTGQP